MTDIERGLQVALDADPGNALLRLVLADHLEEIGDDAEGTRCRGRREGDGFRGVHRPVRVPGSVPGGLSGRANEGRVMTDTGDTVPCLGCDEPVWVAPADVRVFRLAKGRGAQLVAYCPACDARVSAEVEAFLRRGGKNRE